MINTPHISANEDDFGQTVLMPGDPLRSKMIAEKFLENAKLINNIRGVQGYTGYYKGKKVSVMASGMGNPSMGIYSYELFKFFNVENIIRVGSAGALTEQLKIKDIVICNNVYTKTNYANFYEKNGAGLVAGSEKLVKIANEICENLNLKANNGTLYSSDTFYTEEDELLVAKQNNLLAVEMEGASLYLNAKRTNKNALVICTISDNLVTKEHASSDDRQNAFTDMIKVALEIAYNYK